MQHKINFFKWSLTGWKSQLFFSYTTCYTKGKDPSLPYFLHINQRRIVGFIPFPKELALYELQTASSRIWTRVVMSIFYDNNHYAMGMCVYIYIYIYIYTQAFILMSLEKAQIYLFSRCLWVNCKIDWAL